MADESGQDVVERLGGKDLNNDGQVIDLAIVGSSRFYDYEIFEEVVERWVEKNGYPDLIIIGGASGVDYMAERWANNNSLPVAVFTEEWDDTNWTLQDRGRKEAPNSLTKKILNSATHILAMPSPTSKWTLIVIEKAEEMGLPLEIFKIS